MAEIWMDVDTALSGVPVNRVALTDDTDFKTREEAVVYNQAGMDLVWNFVTTAGVYTQTAVTPTTAGVHDWTNKGNGMYSIEIPASGGTINNDTEGFGWFNGIATGILPWTGFIIGFRAAALNNALIDGGDNLDTNVVQWLGTAPATPTTAGIPEVDITHVSGVAEDLPTATALATVDANVDAILVDTGTTLDTHLTDIKGATFSGATDSLEAIRDRGDAAWTGGAGSIRTVPELRLGEIDSTSNIEYIFISDTSGAGLTGLVYNSAGLTAYYTRAGAAATAITLATQTVTGAYSSGGFVQVDATNQPGWYRLDPPNAAYATGVDNFTIHLQGAASMEPAALHFNLSNALITGADDKVILSSDAHTGAVIPTVTDVTNGATSAALATVDANVDAILVDTGTTIPATIATVDANVDAILVDTGTTLPATLTTIEGKVDTVDANVDAVLVDTGTTIPATIATVDANVDAILVDTGTTIPATIATVDTNVDAIKAKTDSLTFTKAGEVDSNAQSINGAAITGDGSATPFDVA